MAIEKCYYDLEPIKNIEECLDRINKLNETEQWIFRGQRESKWNLIPGTGRYPWRSYDKVLNSWVNLRPNYSLKNYAQLVEFNRQIPMKINNKLNNFSRNKRKWLEIIIAQHHRLPTQLLDFTTDPFIALFFAVYEGLPKQSDSNNCIWYIKNKNFKIYDINNDDDFNKLSNIDPNRPELLIINPINIDPRIPVQKSIFICFDDKYKSLNLFPRPLIITRNDIHRIKIITKYRKTILNELDQKGINKEALLLDKNELDETTDKIIEYFEKISKL